MADIHYWSGQQITNRIPDFDDKVTGVCFKRETNLPPPREEESRGLIGDNMLLPPNLKEENERMK